MKKINIFKEILLYVASLFILWFLMQSIIFSKEVIADVRIGIMRCINVLIPSLFGMMAVSEIILKTGLYRKISILFFPFYKILQMPAGLFSVFLLGNLAGYPVGAKLLSQLVKNGTITKETAKNMAVFCYNSGPAFVIGTVGIAVYQSIKAGIYIYASCLIANYIFAIGFSLVLKKSYKKFKTDKEKIKLSSEVLVSSVESSGKSMLMICLMVTAFSVFTSVLKTTGIFSFFNQPLIEKTVMAFMEITNVTSFTGNYTLMPLICFLISFGGICVLLQVKAIVRESFSLKTFLLMRFPVSLVACFVNIFLIKIYPPSITCIKTYSFVQNNLKSSLFSCICLIFMIIIIFFQKSTGNSEKDML